VGVCVRNRPQVALCKTDEKQISSFLFTFSFSSAFFYQKMQSHKIEIIPRRRIALEATLIEKSFEINIVGRTIFTQS
jgi:hypothetical protein